jgi:hypothetical protein
MKTTTMLLLVTFAALGTAASARAQNAGTTQDDGWVPVKHLEFSDEDIEGGWLGPDGDLIVSTERARHASLIEIREGFEAELIKTMENQ